MERDPFAGLQDELAADTTFTRTDLLDQARRGFVRIRKDFVQRETQPRPSVLAKLVSGSNMRALDMLLTVHALQPIFRPDRRSLDIKVWARMLGKDVSVRTANSALKVLQEMDLIEVEGKRGSPKIVLKRENGDGKPWTKEPEENPAERGRGFFTLPFEYWTSGHIDTLKLPGKAMLLVMLKETQDPNGKLTFVMAHERAQAFYGFSERTAERGYLELRQHKLFKEKRQLVKSGEHPLGQREEWHRALERPYSTDYREWLRKRAESAAATAARQASQATP